MSHSGDKFQPQVDPALVEEVRGFDSGQIAALKKRAENDLYFCAKGILGYVDLNPRTHLAFCRFVQDDNQGPTKMQLMPRATLKSCIATIADSFRRIVRNPDHERILIVNEIEENTIDMISEIKGHFQNNELVRMLWGDLIPPRFSGPGITWTSTKVSLNRKTSHKEPNIMGIGLGGAPTSKHFTRIKIDDMIGLEANRSPAVMKKANNFCDNIEPLRISYDGTVVEWTGTRWAKTDSYAHVMKTYEGEIRVFRRSMVENGQLLWPERFGWRQIKLLMKKPAVWFGQYQNNPMSSETSDFDLADLRYYEVDADGRFKLGNDRWPRESLDIVISCDPNSGEKTAPDEAAIVVSGTTPTGDVIVLEIYADRPDPSEYVAKIFSLAMKWRPRIIGVEQAAQQNTLFYLKQKFQEEGIYYRTEPLKHRNVVKAERIRTALEPLTSDHKIWLRRSQTKLIDQVKDHPDLENDDVIDALAYGSELWRRPLSFEQQTRNRDALKKVMAARNKVTGY